MTKHRRDCIRVLLAGTSASDATLSDGTLQNYRRQAFKVEQVDCLAEAVSLAAKGPFDAAVLDLNLPDSHGLETCVKMRQAAPDMPIVVLANADEEPVVLEAIRQSIQDYVIKGPTAGETLGRALYYAVEHWRAQHALQGAQERMQAQTEELDAQTEELRTQTEELTAANEELREDQQRLEAARTAAENERRRLEAVMQALPVGMAMTDTQGGNIQSNDAFEKIWGGPRPPTQSVSDYAAYKAWWADTGKAVAPEEWAAARVVQTGEPVVGQMMEIQRFDGSRAFVINSAAPVRDATGEIVGSAVAIQDITALREAERRLAYLASFPLRNPNPVMEVDENGDIRYMNPAAMRLFPDLAEQGLLHPWLADWATVMGPFRAGRTDTGTRDVIVGEHTYQQAIYHSADDHFVRVYGFDITDRTRAEQALQEANERLQTQAEELRATNEELQAQQEELHSQAEELREAEQALRQANEGLEQRVAERTEDFLNANEALRQAGDYSRSLLEANLDPLVTIGPDGKITDVNAATEAVTGRTRKILVGTDFSDYFTEPEKARAGYQQVFRDGFVRDYPLEVRHKKGHVTEVLYNATVYRDGAGSPVGVFAAARDVTNLRRAEQAVRTEHQRFQNVLDQLPAYLVLLSPDYHVPFANRFFRERFGESGGKRCFEYLFNRTEPCENCETYKVLKTHKPHHWEWTGPDGRNYDIYDFPFTDTDGSPLIMEVGLDITERRKAEAELAKHRDHLEELVRERAGQLEAANVQLQAEIGERRQAESKLERLAQQRQLALDAANMGWWHYDPVTRVSSWDERYKEIFGVTGHSQPNDEILTRLHPDDLPKVWAKVEAALDPANPQPYVAQYRINLPDGSMKWIEAHGIASFAGDGKNRRATSLVGTVADITERKRAEDILQTTLQRMNTFIANMHSSILLVGEDGVVFANQAFCDYFELQDSPADLVGTNAHDMIEEVRSAYLHPDEEVTRIREILERGETVIGEEIAMRDGRMCLRDFIPIRADGMSHGRLWQHTDITERKRQEVRIARLTSLYAVLSRVNEAIVRTRDEPSLFAEVCRIVAEEGGFPLVWIGRVEDRRVVPAAWSGPAQEYLKTIKIELDGKLARGPTGACVRENHAVVNDDFATNPATLPWKQAALQYGFRASAAFPLCRGDNVVAALTLYASQPGVFDAEQVALLESLVADVSYALDALDQEQLKTRAQQKLAEQAFMLANVSDAVIGFDLETRITYWSPSAERMYGYREDEAVGQTSLDLLKPAYAGTTREDAINQLTRTGHLEVETVQSTKDGRKLTIESHSVLLRDEQGRPIGMLGINQDISERKRVEETLRRSKEEWERTFDSVPDLIAILDTQHRIVRVNRAMAARLAVTPERCVGLKCYKCVHGLSRPPEFCPHAHTMADGQEHVAEVHEARLDGDFLVSTTPLLDDSGRMVGAVHVARDVTARKRAEQAIQEAHERLQEQTEELGTANEELRAANEELRQQEQTLQESLETQSRMAERLKLLSDTAAILLAADEPQSVVEALCRKVMEFLDCQAFFNFLVDPQAGRLRLNACAGIPKKERKKIEWLDFGVVVCGCVARDGTQIVAEHIPDTDDPRTALVKSYGITAYACHPIMAGTQVLGTLSFGTKTRDTFDEDEIGLMKAVTDMVAFAVQRRQVQQALRETRDYLDNLFNYANAPIIVWDPQLKITRFNHAFERLTGRRAREVIGAEVGILFSKDSRLKSLAHIRNVTSTGERWDVIEIPILHVDGSTRTVLWNSANVLASDGKTVVATIAQGQDITTRKQVESELRQLNEQLEEKIGRRTEQLTATVDRLQDEVARRVLAEGKLRKNSQMLEGFFQHTITPLAFLDARFNFVRVNEAYAKADGKPPEHFVGKNHFQLYPHEENQAIFEQVVRTKKPYRAYAKRFVYPDDPQRTTFWNWQLTPLLNDGGDVQSLVLNLQDVTEQQQAFEELEQRTRQLQHLALELSRAEDRERKRLAEILHDDLQQILAASKFHLGILNSRVKTDAPLREMTAQVNQLLGEAIEKSRSLSHELCPAVLYQGDLGETFEWLAEQLQAKHGLTVHVETHGRVDSQSEAIKAFLYRSAQEMLFNVVKHAKAREARLRLKRTRGRLWLSIADHGQGFDPKALSKAAGFGLLSIRERVGLLGGRMKIRSAPSRGSTFLIVVPDPQEMEMATQAADAEAIARSAKRKHVEQKDSQRLRVLLVDDHKVMREGLATLLDEQPDMKVVGQAGNGREAVDLAHKLLPDVIVMDAAMPVMGGDEATRQIKVHLPKVRVIGLSMFDEPQMSRKMRKAGAEVYLLKTAPSDKLLAAIRGKGLA